MRIETPTSSKPLRIFLLATFLIIGSGFAYLQVQGDEITDLEKQQKKAIEDKEDELDKIKAQIKAYEDIIKLKNRQGSTLDEQIKGLEAQAGKLELEIAQNEKKVEDLSEDIGTLSSRVNEKTLLVERQKKMLSELMRQYYAQYSSDISPFLLTADESVSYFKESSWNSDLGEKVSDLLDSVQTLRQSLVAEQESLETKKQQVDSLQDQLTERNEYLESAKDNKAALLARTTAEAAKYDDLVDDLREQQEALESEIEDIEAGKIEYLADLPKGNGQLAYPVKSPRITQGYGKTSFSSKAYKSGKHNGIDFGGSAGTTIMSAADGKVIGTGDLGRYAYGKWIAIDHGNGLITLYGHLRKISVSRGESVDRGDKIGEMGSTGFSTGNHLHFTVYAAKSYEVVAFSSAKGQKGPVGASVNPAKYLR